MFLLILFLSILRAYAEQPVIQYEPMEYAHIPSAFENTFNHGKSMYVFPKVSDKAEFLGNPLRRESDDAKPVTESSDTPSLPVPSALHGSPSFEDFNPYRNLNLNYEAPSYSTPKDFQNSVNALTHHMINLRLQKPKPTQAPVIQNAQQNNDLLNVLININKQNKQNEMMSQIMQYVHKKKLEQEQETLVAQLKQQMEREQYEPRLQSKEQAQEFVSFLQNLMAPLKHDHNLGTPVSSAPVSFGVPTQTSINQASFSLPKYQFDWLPSSSSHISNLSPLPSSSSSLGSAHVPNVFMSSTPTPPTFLNSYESSTSQHVPFVHQSHQEPQKDGYVIHMSKPVLMKDELPTSTVTPKTVHHYKHVPSISEYQPKEQFDNHHVKYTTHDTDYKPRPSTKYTSSSLSSNQDMFAPKYESYILNHNNKKSKPQLIKLNNEHKYSNRDLSHSGTKHINTFEVQHEYVNDRSYYKPHPKRRHNRNYDMDDFKFDEEFDFVNNDHHHRIEDEIHSHAPFSTFNNHEFDQEFLKNFDNMYFKEENIPGYKKPTKKPQPKKIPQKYMILKKVTKRS